MTYRRYFNIDPDFFPAVNNDVINKEPDLWKNFYPHETFIKLLKQTISVLERKQKLNIWVEGAYGTGKSHAVLTLKHLLDASKEETDNYFSKNNIDNDLCKRLNSAKQQGKIITVHRYGSSSIYSDNDLFLAMQESIEAALKDAGIQNCGPLALKDAIIKYLSDDENKRSLQVYFEGSYKEVFNGQTVDDILKHLQEYNGAALLDLMNKIFKLGNEKNIKAFSIDNVTMIKWITEVIMENKLKAIIFIWDEFTEYFSNNAHRLTGFQHILDLSQTEPFCFIPVTHRSEAGMDDSDQDKKKILGRFISPTCKIELPENMAFKLIGKALRVINDDTIEREWEGNKNDLENRTEYSRKRIMEFAKINDLELRAILPIHPYAASMLKQISASFASNQRSMFDFIKNVGNEENYGFQWFIDKYGPDDDNPFLTIDLLWGFFYERGKNDLSQPIRQILDRYNMLSKGLNDEEKMVLKTILLFQAISHSSGDTIDVFLPNENNLNYAFEGTDLEKGVAVHCANKLIRDNIIYKRQQRDGSFLYSVLMGEMDAEQLIKIKEDFKNRETSYLIQNGKLNNTVEIDCDLKKRFILEYVGIADFDNTTNKVMSKTNDDNLHFYVIVCLSKNVSESNAIAAKIKQKREQNPQSEVIFIDCGNTPLGEEDFNKWIDNMALSSYYMNKDASQSTYYHEYAQNILIDWGNRIAKGKFIINTKENYSGYPIYLRDLNEQLRSIDKKRFPLSLECNYKSIDNWWDANSFLVGIECGITGNLKGTYKSNQVNLKNILSFAWEGNNRYWEEYPSETISQIKSYLEYIIQNKLKTDGRISIDEIYDYLSGNKTGFLPCNMTAFFMGLLLKEYSDNNDYSWSDDIASDSLSLNKMKEMIEAVIKNHITTDPHYRTKYIVTMSLEEKAFREGTAIAFDIDINDCSSIERTRNRIREIMKSNLYFPIWTLKEILNENKFSIPIEKAHQLIDDYQNLANNITGKPDSGIVNNIGEIYITYPTAVSCLHNILTADNCKKGMHKYLDKYKDGLLSEIASQVNDGGQYINILKNKFANDANWVWKKETVDQQIDVVILEYQIIAETANIFGYIENYERAIDLWANKISNIKISIETIRNYVNFYHFLIQLRDIKKYGGLHDDKKQSFLENVKKYGREFKLFYDKQQFDLFKKSCNRYLDDLSENDKEKVFNKISGEVYRYEYSEYSDMVKETVEEYKTFLNSSKLRNLWKEKTNTDSPNSWSSIYNMPILAMIPDDEQEDCRKIFDILNNQNSKDKENDKAFIYLSRFSHWNDLSNESKRDKAFRENLLGDKSIMIQDINDVKNYIRKNAHEVSPYYWNGNGKVESLIKEYAEDKYISNGFKKPFEKIDSMSADVVKNYLKKLIRNNMIVGIQIINNE